jgi:hypothetical protein
MSEEIESILRNQLPPMPPQVGILVRETSDHDNYREAVSDANFRLADDEASDSTPK